MSDLQHPRFARAYARISVEADERGGAAHRRRLLAGAAGTVLEVGAGNGRNFGQYPPSVTGVLAVEPDDTLRAIAEEAARSAPVPVRVVAGDADALPAGDGEVDVVVASLVLCSVPDVDRALAEMARVLRPGGELRYYEHVRSARPVGALLEDAVVPLWRRMAGGCRPNRRTGEAVRAVFDVEHEERFRFRPAALGPASDHLVGLARRR